MAEQGVTVSFLPVGEPRIELLEPLATNPGPVGRFLEQRGPGIHHICLRVNDLDSLLAQLDNAGIQLIDRAHARVPTGCALLLCTRRPLEVCSRAGEPASFGVIR